MNLNTPIKDAGHIYKMYASRLGKLGIKTFEDFLYHVPFRYEDYSLISKIKDLQAGETVTIQGTVVDIKNEITKNFKKIQRAKVSDETESIDVIWFNQPYLLNAIKKNSRISLSGKIDFFKFNLVMESPEYELITQNKTIHTGRLVPVYSETRGVSSKWLRRQVYKIIQEQGENLFEYIPDSIIKELGLTDFRKAIEQIHFPKSFSNADAARQRLSFDELFLMQLKALLRRKEWEKYLAGRSFEISKFHKKVEEFLEKLPFELTGAQKRAVSEIFKDLGAKKPMNRLLEGEVGSGKTVVSAIAMYLAFLNGFQSVLMAPTEILAQQHHKTISDLLSPFGIKVESITGSSKKYQTPACRQAGIGNWKFDILIGTHALLSQKIKFENLGMVVIDEQQRFGVEQRAIIKQKGNNPHLLTMTATPIPRTVALTMYGDLDLSFLNEMPIGRKKVKTWLVPEEKRGKAYEWIISQLSQPKADRPLAETSQLFVICPFIEESESIQTVKAASKEFERLKNNVFPKFKVGLLHGKLKSKEKDEVLQKFKNKEFDILVATPIVEVGIDIANATIMVIEGAERFGLSQLHQLRGRVGRGDKQSYCLLFSESRGSKAFERLKAMERMHNGAELAELDLKLRGPGEIFGTSQHGIPKLKIASFSDFELIQKARIEAEEIFPKLSQYPKLIGKLEDIKITQVSPD